MQLPLWAYLWLLLLCFRSALQKSNGNGNNATANYITWNDFSIDNRLRISLGDSANQEYKAMIVVDKNGGGDSATVQGAIDIVPENNMHRVKVHILPGVYREKVLIPVNKPYITFIGNEASETVISWHDKASDSDGYGGTLGTLNSASVTVLSKYFCATNVTFENTVVEPADGPQGYQGVAFRIFSEKAVFYKVRFLGSQDTLLDDAGSHYFYQCFIQGSVDFIFGKAKSLYRECTISVVNNPYAITAQHRNTAAEDTGFSFVNCTVTGAGPVYLGRAWGNYSRTVYSYAEFDLDVLREGWNDWNDSARHKTAMFGEYKCRGRGAHRSGMVESLDRFRGSTLSKHQIYRWREVAKILDTLKIRRHGIFYQHRSHDCGLKLVKTKGLIRKLGLAQGMPGGYDKAGHRSPGPR